MDPLEKAIRHHLARYLAGGLSLNELQDWHVNATWNMETMASPNAVDLAYALELILAEFSSAVDAVECAAAIQRAMAAAIRDESEAPRIVLRIGLHVGDVIVDGDDRHGDAVNVAARLQELAEPNGICVSRRVMDLARQKVAFGFELRGEERL